MPLFNHHANFAISIITIGARVFTNSWGAQDRGGSRDIEVDEFMWQHPDCIVIFSAGNNGAEGAASLLSPADAKNVLTVGASLNTKDSFLAYENVGVTSLPDYYDIDSVADFSSQGPTEDNRLKPDILAPGFWVTSMKGEA